MKYSKERKESILKKMMPPNNKPIPEIAEEEGISAATLYNWRNEARKAGRLLPANSTSPEGYSSRDKFSAVLETASMNEEELAEYCRKRGLFPEQIKQWRQACEQANDWDTEREREVKVINKQQNKRVKELERELNRKDKALAEAAALMWLGKKVEALWDEDGEE